MEAWLPLLGAIALLVAPILGFLGVWIGARASRASSKEANETIRFEKFTAALETRLAKAEARIDELEKSEKALQAERQKSIAITQAQARYIRKLLRLIASFAPEMEQVLISPDPEDAPYITESGASLLPHSPDTLD